jgi:hypothetical protein
MRCTAITVLICLEVALTGCTCVNSPVPTWVLGQPAPIVDSPQGVECALREVPNDPLPWFSRLVGFLTTSFGKNLGIRGWCDMHMDIDVTGFVLDATCSTDWFETIDLEVLTLRVKETDVVLRKRRYLRSEVCMCLVPLHDSERPKVGDIVTIHGRLKWDSDGFLEVHPTDPDSVHVLEGSNVGSH